MIYFNSTHLYLYFKYSNPAPIFTLKQVLVRYLPYTALEFFNITTKWWFVVIRILVYQNNSP